MNTPPGNDPRPATGGRRADDAVLRAVADMPPGWTVLRDCALADGDDGAPARVRYALLHPDIGIALFDVLPGSTTPGAPDLLRRLLDAASFRSAFGGYPPIVYLCVPSRSLLGLETVLTEEFEALPPLTLAGGDAWVGTAQGLLTAEPPLRVPGRTAAGRQRLSTLARSADRPARWALPGLRGIAVFWGAVGLAFGGGALVLQSLGPPEGSHAVARAGGTGQAEPPAPLPASEAWVTLPTPDTVRLSPPGPIFALWPAERMPTRFDADRAGAVTPETAGDAVVHASRPVGDRPAPAASVTPDRPQRPWPPSVPRAEARATAAPTRLAGLEEAGSAAAVAEPPPDPAPAGGSTTPPAGGVQIAPEALPYPPRAPLLGEVAQTEGSGASREALPAAPPARTEAGAPGATPAPNGSAPPADLASGGTQGPPMAANGSLGPDAVPGGGVEGAAAAVYAAESDTPPAPHANATAPAAQTVGPAPGPAHVREAPPAAASVDGAGPGIAPGLEAGEPAPPPSRVAFPAAPEPAGVEAASPTSNAGLAPPHAAAGGAAGRPGASSENGPPPGGSANPAQPVAAPVQPAETAVPSTAAAAASVAEPATKPQPPPPSSASPAAVAALLARGDALIAIGDVAAARLVYQRAAAHASARAATAAGKTYDPRFLQVIGAIGVVADPDTAAAWYRKGAALGDEDATPLLGGLDVRARQ